MHTQSDCSVYKGMLGVQKGTCGESGSGTREGKAMRPQPAAIGMLLRRQAIASIAGWCVLVGGGWGFDRKKGRWSTQSRPYKHSDFFFSPSVTSPS